MPNSDMLQSITSKVIIFAMDISFDNRKLHRDCTVDKSMQRRWGANRTKLLRRRLDQLAAASTLSVMRSLPGGTHELKGDRKGTFSIDLDGPYRLIFVPDADSVPALDDGGIDWNSIESIRVLGVEATHEKYD